MLNGEDAMTSPQMNSIDTIRQFNVIARRYYHNENVKFKHESYIRECFECLLSFFSTELFVGEGADRENAYLFAALTYKREDNPNIDLVKITDGLGYYYAAGVERGLANSLNLIIDELYQAIHKERSMSVTKALLKDKKRGKDLFLYSGAPYEPPVEPANPDVQAKIALFPLKDLAFDPADGEERFCEINKRQIADFRAQLDQNAEMKLTETDQQIGVLLWHYKRMEKLYLSYRLGKEFLVHFIRPSFIDFGHNILLSLGTSRRLSVDQLSLIYLLVYRIVSQTVIEKTKQAEREKSSYYAFGIGHFLKHRISPVVSHLVNAEKFLVTEYGIGSELQNSIILAQTALGSASVLDLFGKTLAKRTTEPDYTEFGAKTIKRLFDNDANLQGSLDRYRLRQTPIKVRDLLREAARQIKREWEKELDLHFDDARDWERVLIGCYIKFNDRHNREVSFCPKETIYHQFLHELLKNISKSDKHAEQRVEISYETSGGEASIIISREISYTDEHKLRTLGVGYTEYSETKGGLSGMTLIERYVDVLGIGKLQHKLFKSAVIYLKTKLMLKGLYVDEP